GQPARLRKVPTPADPLPGSREMSEGKAPTRSPSHLRSAARARERVGSKEVQVTRTQAASQFHAAEARRPPGVDRNVSIPRNWRLENGGRLEQRVCAIRLYGPENAPLVAVAGRVSSGGFIWTGDGGGWWASLLGPARALDHSAWRVLDFAPPSNQRIEITP